MPSRPSTRSRSETPPRTWGRLRDIVQNDPHRGNTPTYVGKTQVDARPDGTHLKHPHVRGEDVKDWIEARRKEETPPRTWGRHNSIGFLMPDDGNTPTYVGKTRRRVRGSWSSKKHPHVRGEDFRYKNSTAFPQETPPRTWGRLAEILVPTVLVGNTPTYVGKTVGFNP